jgi:outer membrane murein-binding lipoprotein Lpp
MHKQSLFAAVSCALLIVGCASRAKEQPGNIVLKSATGKAIEVPLSGSLYDARAAQLAREIQTLDQQIAKGRKQRPAATPETDVIQDEMLNIAIEARNDALADLGLALEVARKTSAGSLDEETIARAKEDADSAMTVLNTQPPSSIAVATNISTSVADATLHYMSKAKHRQRSTDWSSYTEGERMRIGRYVFRVQPPETGTPLYEELVLIIADPTQKRLTPVRAPSQ